jgi:hypothetical protein
MDISSLKLYEQQMAVNATSLVNAAQTDSSSVSQSDSSGKTDSFESTLASVLTSPITSEYTASGALTADDSSASAQTISTTATADTTGTASETDKTSGSSGTSSGSKGTTETTTELVRQPDGSIYLKTTTKNADGTSTVTLTKISDGGANAAENILGVNASDKLQDILNGKQNNTSVQTGTPAAGATTGA